LWQSHVILSHAPPCSCKSKEKEKEKKRNINNDLAVLPSHDIIGFTNLLCAHFTCMTIGHASIREYR